MRTVTVSRSLFARLIGVTEDLKNSLVNACGGFDEQVSEEEIEEWDALLAEANAALKEE